MTLKLGKLPNNLLKKLLKRLTITDPRVLQGPGIGEDTAHISFGNKTLIVKSDPITFATDNLGWYALNVNANDIATSGAVPRWFTATVLLPEGVTEEYVEDLFGQLESAARELNVSLIGGHTEVTLGLDHPIICGTIFGEIHASKALTTSGAKEGDAVLMYGFGGIEGTSILASEVEPQLIKLGMSKEKVKKAKGLLVHPGISVVKPALAAAATGLVSSMHDATEGGISTALNELCMASGNGISIEKRRIPFLDETTEICDLLEIDPLGLISSGALLMTTDKKNIDTVIGILEKDGFTSTCIGKLTKPPNISFNNPNEFSEPIPNFQKDELVRFFEKIRRK